MAKHEFGIMESAPAPEREYDAYEPAKYRCISIADEAIEPLLEAFLPISCYWHSLKRKETGLAYCGITLIPPESLEAFLVVIGREQTMEKLKGLLRKAQEENKFVIHFGI